jgi:hypothetical protein
LIPNNKNTFTVDNNLGGEKVKMQISADATVHLMGLLTDLYSDPELACIREYSTNAWDSHIDAGNTDPIRVTTPTALDPYLTIQDFGVGMDEETIRNIYSQYGESTKRAQKTTNGSMGIGAKAALGYTNQFTVAGVKHGVKTLVSVSRDEDGAGVMEIVYSGPSVEPSGVTIKIPVKPVNSFKSKAQEFFSYWKEGTVLLNGKSPVVKREALTDRIFFTDRYGVDVIVMGNVAYPLDMNNYSISGSDGRKVACYVEMNGKDEVTFTPSREGLIYNAVTKSAVVNLRNEYQKKITEHVNSSIVHAKDYHEAFTLSAKYRGMYRWLGSNVKWNGHAIEDFMLMDDRIVDNNGKVQYARFLGYNMFTTYRPVSDGHGLSYSGVVKENSVIITGYPAKKTISAGNKERIQEYVTEIKKLSEFSSNRRYYGAMVYLTDMETITKQELFDVDKHQIYKWSDVMAKTREPAPAAPKTAGKYHCYDGTRFTLREVNEDEKIVYWSPARDTYYKPRGEQIKDLAANFPDYTLIADNANRHAKIDKDFKNAVSWYKFQQTYEAMVTERDFKKLNDDFFEHYYVNSRMSFSDLGLPWNPNMKALDMLDDKEYARIARMMYRRPNLPTFAAEHADFEKRVEDAKPASLKTRNFRREYPMVCAEIWKENPDAVVNYMNELYAKRKGKN